MDIPRRIYNTQCTILYIAGSVGTRSLALLRGPGGLHSCGEDSYMRHMSARDTHLDSCGRDTGQIIEGSTRRVFQRLKFDDMRFAR
jgi:hypothetical protein